MSCEVGGVGQADKLFRRAARQGAIDERRGRYVIPVPSMQDWLVSNYARAQDKAEASRLIAEGRARRAPELTPEPSRDVQEPGSRRDFGR